MINIFLADPISSVILALRQFYSADLSVVNDIAQADIVISSDIKLLSICNGAKPSAKFLHWVNEPRWSSNTTGFSMVNGRTVYVMNAFTGDVFIDKFHYLWVARYKKVEHFTSADYQRRLCSQPEKIVCMASQHGNGKGFYVDGINIDLYELRRSLALHGHSIGCVSIFGQGWPEGIAGDESRFGQSWGDWEERKLQLTGGYLFNICFENTNSKNYVTEKWWHSIMARNIPIYYSGQSGIDELFDKSCFIDCTGREIDDIYHEIFSLNESQYLQRLNELIDTFNRISSDTTVLLESRRKISEAFVVRVRQIFESI